jgi:ribosomal protein S18 acetylase RimI-like enzyme
MRFVNVSCHSRVMSEPAAKRGAGVLASTPAVSEPVLRAVNAADTRPLRQRVLRPNEKVDALVWPHDDAPETLHAGAFLSGAMVATATLHREPPPRAHFPNGEHDATAWRLRGMATDPDLRARGLGRALVDMCILHARARGGTLVWCNARASAAGFYDKLGFARHGDAFELPNIGPHYVMSKLLLY